MAKVYTIIYNANAPELDLNTWYASKGDPVLPGYRTNSSLMQWMTGAANANIGTMVSNPNVDISASKIILSDNLDWDIENQLVIFAKQSIVFDGNGKTITLTKAAVTDCYGLIAAPHQYSYRDWNDALDGYKGQYTYYRQDVAQWYDYINKIDDSTLVEISDDEDPYGIIVKNLIIDAETNSVNNAHSYMFGRINTGSNYQGGYAHDGRPMTNGNVTESTKNLFIVEKCQIKCLQSSVSNTEGAFSGKVYGRGKFINCIANTHFIGNASVGWWEFENCFINSNKGFIADNLNKYNIFESRNTDAAVAAIIYPPIGSDTDGSNLKSHYAYNKYIFKNCIAKQIYYRFEGYSNANTSNATNENVVGGLLEISGCKVSDSTLSDNYFTNNNVEDDANFSTLTNNTTEFTYLSGSTVDTSKLDDILEVINVSDGFKKVNNKIVIEFSPFVGVSITDYVAVKAIDLTSTNTVAISAVPTTWFDNLVGSGDTLERNTEVRRNNLIDTIFENNSTKTFFDISKSEINASINSIKESTRIFKVDSTSNKAIINLNTNTDLGDIKGFYVSLADNQKVDITSKDGNITFQVERTGTGSDGKATYTVTKTAGTVNLLIDS
tara:strand:- start:63 stop:1889 length:1827 start_codon:yes stop_codon:yes gene_type:complete